MKVRTCNRQSIPSKVVGFLSAKQRNSTIFQKVHFIATRNIRSSTCRAAGNNHRCSLPNSTFLLQPADVAVFKSLKSLWDEIVRKEKFYDIDKSISQVQFAQLFFQAFEKITSETIRNGFKACGISPWNSQSVDYRDDSTADSIINIPED